MDCDIYKLDSGIGACEDKTHLGYNRTGWWTIYDEIDQTGLTIADGMVSFTPSTNFYEIYDGSMKPFMGTKIGMVLSDKHQYPLTNQTVAFPLREDTVANSLLVASLARGKRIVVILDQKGIATADDGKYPIYGLSGGLLLKTPLSEKNSDAAWELEFEDKNVRDELLFVDAETMALLKDYETITGLTIETGDIVAIETDSIYEPIKVYYPDGTISESSTDPETGFTGIYETYTGVGGAVIVTIPDGFNFNFSENNIYSTASEFGGVLQTRTTSELAFKAMVNLVGIVADNTWYIDAASCESLKSVSAKKSYKIYANNCALTATSINSIMANAKLLPDLSEVAIAVNQGTSADTALWSAQAIIDANAIIAGGGSVIANDAGGLLNGTPPPLPALPEVGDDYEDTFLVFAVDSGTRTIKVVTDEYELDTWDDAVAAASGYENIGLSDWRLPTVTELTAILNNDAIATAYSLYGKDFWTSETVDDEAYIVSKVDSATDAVVISDPTANSHYGLYVHEVVIP
jgi:hypothetical protein